MTATYDVIVIGGGHAGAEAAWAASKLGARTALVTMTLDAIGRMSCNPAVGGLGKGHIVREIDALGGLMGRVIDATGIQFRLLNRTKGPAVWAPRAQADRADYAAELRRWLANALNLQLVPGRVEWISTQSDGREPRVAGVALDDGTTLRARAVVVATGTFLRGLMHCGEQKTEGGRIGEPPSRGLSEALESLGFELGRLKTGTPPRVHRDSVDYDAMETQPGDEPPVPFSFLTDAIDRPQVHCWITHTNPRTHELIRANLHRAPLYTGQIRSTGPRYCPSIEVKVVRFEDKPSHQVFLEPEGLANERLYCNGISTSLPRDVQEQMVHSITGLERARIVQYGYAIEYDFVPTHQLDASLEAKRLKNLFLAGQINGTSGYEEAAGQGLVAGVNAVRSLGGQEPFIPRRDEAYIGVMIDDLITKPPIEPYRMFTSRAEYRLHLRIDNADARLTPAGRRLGLADDDRWDRFQRKRQEIEQVRTVVESVRYDGRPLAEWLRRPEATTARLREILAAQGGPAFTPEAMEQVLLESKYAGYLARQQRQIERFQQLESLPIPSSLDYSRLRELRREARERFAQVAPRTLGQAGRITGISPADVTTLWVYLSARPRGSASAGRPDLP